MNDEERFENFVENLCAGGPRIPPLDWPRELRERCLFFARMLELEEPPGDSATHTAEVTGSAAGPGSPETGLETAAGASSSGEGRPEGERYEVEDELGRGGMGRVLLVRDRELRRRVAMKVLPVSPGSSSSSRRSRFLEEAQATAQLEHPNIAPVYDVGCRETGELYFTMKWVRGRNLRQIIREEGASGVALLRLVQMLAQAALGVSFAHSHGVIHRDLKPQNIMVGDFGEVLVVDWGLAKIRGRREAAVPEGPPALSTDRSDGGRATIEGSVQGSPAYLSPEQALGRVSEIDERTDVFGLGAVLYEILTGTPPQDEASAAVALGRARAGDLEAPSVRAPSRQIPPDLEIACLRALSFRKEDRYQSARELHEALQSYIEGIHDRERRAAEAQRLLLAAEALLAVARGAALENEARAHEVDAARRGIEEHDPEDRKTDLWNLEQHLRAEREATSLAFERAEAAYQAVLSIEPEHSGAHAALAQLYLERLLVAEEAGERDAARHFEGLVRQHRTGPARLELDAPVPVRLTSDPPGAVVALHRYEERGPLLVATPLPEPGLTPLEIRLPRGSYLAEITASGRVPTRYPFVLDRTGPLEALIQLPREGSLPPGLTYVPAGWSVVGGKDRAVSALPRGRVFVEALVAGTEPVTLGEYCLFLEELFAGGKPADTELLPAFGEEAYVERAGDGPFRPVAQLGPQYPVMALPPAAVARYCDWLGRRLGRRFRLLTAVEWERCARGADGRLHPWGNGFDWALCHGGLSLAGRPFPGPVGAYPRDVSPFGVRDLAGCVRELIDGPAPEGYLPCRGGSWLNPYPFVFRADFATTRAAATRSTDVGFRVCYNFLHG